MVILQETICNAGLSESVTVSALKPIEVIKGGGTLDTGEKKPEVEALFRLLQTLQVNSFLFMHVTVSKYMLCISDTPLPVSKYM